MVGAAWLGAGGYRSVRWSLRVTESIYLVTAMMICISAAIWTLGRTYDVFVARSKGQKAELKEERLN